MPVPRPDAGFAEEVCGGYNALMLLPLLAACRVSLSSDCETTSLADDAITALGIWLDLA